MKLFRKSTSLALVSLVLLLVVASPALAYSSSGTWAGYSYYFHNTVYSSGGSAGTDYATIGDVQVRMKYRYYEYNLETGQIRLVEIYRSAGKAAGTSASVSASKPDNNPPYVYTSFCTGSAHRVGLDGYYYGDLNTFYFTAY